LRETLEPLQNSLAIETVRGVGFRLSSVIDVPQLPALEAAQQTEQAPLQPPASPAAPAPASRAPKRPGVGARPRAGAPRHNPPALVSDRSAAVEKIRHLQSLLQRKTEENRLLRDAVDAAKPMSSGGALASAQHKDKR